MASNDSTLADGDGNFSDWIEIYNPTAAAIDLSGWHLTDDSTSLEKWSFPSLPQTVLDPGEYLVVFASGQATETYVDPGGNLHTNFRLDVDGEYLALSDASESVVQAFAPEYPALQQDVSYGLSMQTFSTTYVGEDAPARFIVPTEEITDWNTPTFVDTSWSVGNTGIGYEDSSADYEDFIETTVPNGTTSVYLRQSFNVVDTGQIDSLLLSLRYDDGFVAYLNGELVASHNAPSNPAWNSAAASSHSDSAAVVFAPFDITDHLDALQNGNNVLAIQALNRSGSTDMLIEPRLSASLSSLVEPLEMGQLASPSPGGVNTQAYLGYVEDTTFSIDRGFYNDPISVDITTLTPGASIVYTTDGSAPTLTNGVQVLPADANSVPVATVPIASTTVLRAAAFKDDYVPTNVDTQTYVFLADIISSPVLDTSITQNPSYAPLLEQAFTDIPSISLVFPNTASGNEQPTSVEWLSPDGGPEFQIDAGITTFGGAFTNFSKKSFRLYFRNEYGASKLEFPLFDGFDRGIPATESFDQLNLRSGSHDMSMRGFYMSNRFTDDTMLDAGNIAPHGRFVHLYLNGVYWGQFHLRERWNDEMVADYLGGDSDEYESINGNQNVNGWSGGDPYDGDGSGWENIKSLMGDYENIRQYVDVKNFIDYMLLYMSGNSENEYRTSGVPDGSTPYHFFLNDADGWLRSVGDRTGEDGPPKGPSSSQGIFGSLVSEGNPDFMSLLGDRIQALFFNDGVLSPEKATARLQERLDEIQNSFIAEAARWGYRSPSSWENAANDALTNILPNLAPTMIARLRARGLYPSTDAPVFNQHGGAVPSGFPLELSFDTLPAPGNLALDRPTTQSSNGYGFTGAQAVDGNNSTFSHTDTGDLTPFLKVDLEGEALIETIVLRNRADGYQDRLYNITVEVLDEFDNVVYTSPVFNPVSPGGSPTNPGATLTLDLTGEPGGGVHGNQIRVSKVAVDGPSDSECLSLGEIQVAGEYVGFVPGSPKVYYTLDGSDPRLPGGALNPNAIEYVTTPIPLTTGVTVRARALQGTDWSALNQATFTVDQPADATNLRVSELHYNPAEPNAAEVMAGFTDNNEFEFIELLNTSSQTIELQGVTLSDAVDLTFNDSTILAPGERVVVVENQGAFEARYGTSIRIIGQWTGKLSNGGETLTLTDQAGQIIQSFTYEDGEDPGEEAWPTSPDGDGPSLVVVDVEGDYNEGSNWKASNAIHGSPGSEEIIQNNTPSGDFDGDSDVDGADFLAWQRGFGITGTATPEDGDANNDNKVDAIDLGIWQTQYGSSDLPTVVVSYAVPDSLFSLAALSGVPLNAARITALEYAYESLEVNGSKEPEVDFQEVPSQPFLTPTDAALVAIYDTPVGDKKDGNTNSEEFSESWALLGESFPEL